MHDNRWWIAITLGAALTAVGWASSQVFDFIFNLDGKIQDHAGVHKELDLTLHGRERQFSDRDNDLERRIDRLEIRLEYHTHDEARHTNPDNPEHPRIGDLIP